MTTSRRGDASDCIVFERRVQARLALLAVSLLAVRLGGRGHGAEVVVGMDKEIFGNAEAAEMVQEARKFDPARSRDSDLSKAVELYERAIALQPGAKINAVLASRIAQLYSYAIWPAMDWQTRRAKAIPWWRRAIEESGPQHLLWAHAQVGLASTAFLARKPGEAIAAYEAVLAVDTDKMEVPNWKAWPDPNTERGRRQREAELARIRKEAQRFRMKAVEMVHYVMMRANRKAAAGALFRIAKQYKGTPVGQRAAALGEEALKRTSKGL